MIRWYVYQTHPQRERDASQELRDRGFETLAPQLMKRLERHNPFSRKKKLVSLVPVPLFPCYGFVRFDRERDQWKSVNGTPHVRRLIQADEETPWAIPQAQMDHLMKRIDGEGFWFDAKDEKPWKDLKVGQIVRLADGPFTSFPAKMEEIDDNGRIKVLVAIFGREAPYRLNWDQVEV